ncbi:MAG: hypothetical protein ACE10O_06940 [Candidatus Acidiferrales bacterium]
MSQISLTAGKRQATGPKGGRRAGTRRPTDQAFLDHYFKRLDPAVADSFSEQQKHAIWTLFGARGTTKHAVELRRTLPLPGGRRFYMVFLCGREQRGITRLHGQGARARGVELLWYLGLGALGLTPVLALLYIGLL